MNQKERVNLKSQSIIVMDGVEYFQSGRLEELKTDDVYYIKAFIKMIGMLSEELKKSL